MQSPNQLISLCQKAQFMTSASRLDQCPEDQGQEIAFVGRSNAGKSSAINCLTRANLARTSKTPGRTQLMNFFQLDEQHRLVDLPGYGYAKVPIPLKQHWQQHLDNYLSERQSLVAVVLMMDIRHPLTPFDQMFIDWAKTSKMPLHILLNKADKLKFSAARTSLQQVNQAIDNEEGNISCQLFSAMKRTGVAEAHEKLFNLFTHPENVA